MMISLVSPGAAIRWRLTPAIVVFNSSFTVMVGGRNPEGPRTSFPASTYPAYQPLLSIAGLSLNKIPDIIAPPVARDG